MIAWIGTESAEEASALLGSLRSQGYVAEIVAEREIEIQALCTDSTELVVGVDAPPVCLPVDHFVFCSDRADGSAGRTSCEREFVLMPLFRQVAWRSRAVLALLQNVLHAVRFIGRDLLEDLRQERSDLWASRIGATNSTEGLPKTEQPIRSGERASISFGLRLRHPLPQTVGLVLATFVLITLIVHVRGDQSDTIDQPANAYAHYPAVEPAITRASAPIQRSRPRSEFDGSLATSTTSAKRISSQASKTRMLNREEQYPEVIVHRYPSSQRSQVIAGSVRHYSDLD